MTAEHEPILASIAHGLPRCSVDELTREFNRRSGSSVCAATTVRRVLRRTGIKRMRPTRKAAELAPAQGGAPVRVGYTARHRCEPGVSGMNADLTDTAWALVAELFERRGGRSAPVTNRPSAAVGRLCSLPGAGRADVRVQGVPAGKRRRAGTCSLGTQPP